MKRAMQNAMRSGAKGIKIMTSGRLNGADIARSDGTVKSRTFAYFACKCRLCN